MKLIETARVGSSVWLIWDPVPGAEGYLFYRDGVRVGRTFTMPQTPLKFYCPAGSTIRVAAIRFAELDADIWPDSATPPPLTYVKVAPRVAYKEGSSDARYCTVNQPGVYRDPMTGHAVDEVGTYDENGLCTNGKRSDGSDKDCPTGALQINGRDYCSLPTQGDPTKNTGSWIV